jgi:Holliday junction resolvase RusA-like endonuclease
LERAIQSTTHARKIPSVGPLEVRIKIHRRPARRGDVDNIAKPILDAMREVLGADAWGRADDHRVRRLVVEIRETTWEESIVLEIASPSIEQVA